VVAQLQSNRYYLYMYLDALFQKDPQSAYEYSDDLVDLYAEYDYRRLLDCLRASTSYSLEKAYEICKKRDFVPEMVFLLGRMGNNKQALTLIIERLGDVQRVRSIAFIQDCIVADRPVRQLTLPRNKMMRISGKTCSSMLKASQVS
jgi:hypothetical protein